MTTKIAVSLPDDLVEAARRAVQRGEAASVSAYVAAAMDRFEEQRSLEELLAELDRAHGAPSAEDYAWADAVLEG